MKTVLIVDDNEHTRRSTAAALGDAWHVHEVAGVAEARSFLTTLAVDVVLADWILDDGYGCDVLLWLRAQGRTTPVVLLTGGNGPENDPGFAARLTKPVTAVVLLLTLRRFAGN